MGSRIRRAAALFVMALLLAACGPHLQGSGSSPGPTSSPAESGVPSPTALPSPSPSPSPVPAPTPTPTPEPTATPVPPPAPAAQGPPVLAGRAIVISLSQQHLWIVVNRQVVFDTLVTTGRPALPTPTGNFSVLQKKSPIHWISPYPVGSPYYFPPTLWSQQGLLFRDGGYWIHDANWQANWGPGADYITGSHGCVNVPVGAMPTIYAWAALGDAVLIRE